jgi:hypothetical protein
MQYARFPLGPSALVSYRSCPNLITFVFSGAGDQADSSFLIHSAFTIVRVADGRRYRLRAATGRGQCATSSKNHDNRIFAIDRILTVARV